jgi:hypothetical protein
MIADSVVDSEDDEQLQRALALSLEVDDFVSLAGGRVFVSTVVLAQDLKSSAEGLLSQDELELRIKQETGLLVDPARMRIALGAFTEGTAEQNIDARVLSNLGFVNYVTNSASVHMFEGMPVLVAFDPAPPLPEEVTAEPWHQELRDKLAAFDTDQDGVLNRTEFAKFLACLATVDSKEEDDEFKRLVKNFAEKGRHPCHATVTRDFEQSREQSRELMARVDAMNAEHETTLSGSVLGLIRKEKSTVPSRETGSWACEACTFVNTGAVPRCSVCDKSRAPSDTAIVARKQYSSLLAQQRELEEMEKEMGKLLSEVGNRFQTLKTEKVTEHVDKEAARRTAHATVLARGVERTAEYMMREAPESDPSYVVAGVCGTSGGMTRQGVLAFYVKCSLTRPEDVRKYLRKLEIVSTVPQRPSEQEPILGESNLHCLYSGVTAFLFRYHTCGQRRNLCQR